MCFFGKFIFHPLLYFEVELLIVIQLYFITVNGFQHLKMIYSHYLQKLLIVAPKS